MASMFQDSVAQALAEQPWWLRRKDTLVAVAGTVIQIANIIAALATGWPEWVNVIIAGVIGVAQIVIHAGTKGAITPSMAERLEEAGDHAHAERIPVSGVAVLVETEPSAPVVEDPLPVYAGETSATYTGTHRLEE